MGLQKALRLIYPPACIRCSAYLDEEFALCGDCWRNTPFIAGLICDACGVPLPGASDAKTELRDDCMVIARPWDKGRAALLYAGNARRLVLALKHGDRLDLAVPAARWLAKPMHEMIGPGAVIAPIPAHWTRLIKRRYNQATQDGIGRGARFANMASSIRPHARRGVGLAGKEVLLVDDVMTSRATFAAATEACFVAGATRVCVLALARVAKDA